MINSGLHPISIKDLQRLNGIKSFTINQYINTLNSSSPVKGMITIETNENKLYVKANIKAIVKETCDRCSNLYSQKLHVEVEEMIILKGKYKENDDINNEIDPLIERLDSSEDFDLEQWAFEQLSLEMPLLKSCGDQCSGFSSYLNKEKPDPNKKHLDDKVINDPRWSPLHKFLES